MSAARPEAAPFTEKAAGASHSKQSLRVWLRLFSCATVVEKTVRARLEAEFDTTLPRFDALAALERHSDGLTMTALSDAMMVSSGNVTGVIARLIDDGWVTRETHESDRRVSTVRLTAKGRQRFLAMAAAHERWIDELFADVGDTQAKQLMATLADVRRSIERHRR
jgi:DNA-binding MarR family transcriptional regulator